MAPTRGRAAQETQQRVRTDGQISSTSQAGSRLYAGRLGEIGQLAVRIQRATRPREEN